MRQVPGIAHPRLVIVGNKDQAPDLRQKVGVCCFCVLQPQREGMFITPLSQLDSLGTLAWEPRVLCPGSGPASSCEQRGQPEAPAEAEVSSCW